MKIRFWGTHGSIVTLAEGKSVAVDLVRKIAVGINDENLLVILAVQFADHGLFRLFNAAGKVWTPQKRRPCWLVISMTRSFSARSGFSNVPELVGQ